MVWGPGEGGGSKPLGVDQEVLAKFSADYPGLLVQLCRKPPPEVPDCLSISLQNLYFIYFFLHESLIRYLNQEELSSPLQRATEVA